MEKLKALLQKYREIIMYLVFGVLTTLVGWIVYFAIFWTWKAAFAIPADNTTDVLYITGYTVAQVVQWICAMLFAFFTNRKWVFTDADTNVSIPKQLTTFAGGRLVTFGMDYVVTYFGGIALSALFPSITAVMIFGGERNIADIIAKVVAAVIVIIANYVISKIFVFKKRQNSRK